MPKNSGRQKAKTRKHSTTKNSSDNFDSLLREAVDETFASLGEATKKAIYFHLENKFGIKKKEIPLRLGEFSDALEKLFGLGAKHLEIMLMMRLHRKLPSAQCKFKCTSDLTLQGYVELKKKNFLRTENVENLEIGVWMNSEREAEHLRNKESANGNKKR